MTDDRERRYRFGPRNQRGVVASLQPLQVFVLTLSAVAAVATVRLLPSHSRLVIALMELVFGVGIALLRIAERPVISWIGELGSYIRAGLNGSRRVAFRSSGGRLFTGAVRLFAGFQFVEIVLSGRKIGALYDAADRTLSIVLPVHSEQFVLLDEVDRTQKIAEWSSLLAALNTDRSLYRLKWISQSVPDIEDRYRASVAEAVLQHVSRNRQEAMDSYAKLCEELQRDALSTNQFIVVSTRAPRSLVVRPHGEATEAEAQEVAGFVKQVLLIERRFGEVGIKIDGACTKRGITGMTQRLFDDSDRPVQRKSPWPVALEERWECVRTDNLWHATYWIAEWPKTEVSTGFLLPLLLDSTVRRNVTICMSPIRASRATRTAERRRTSSFADVELRRRYGFAMSSRLRSQHEAVVQREEELAHGHVAFEFSGYVTVSSGSIEGLQRACEQIEQSCAMAHLEVRRLFGMQRASLLFGLGNGRGCI